MAQAIHAVAVLDQDLAAALEQGFAVEGLGRGTTRGLRSAARVSAWGKAMVLADMGQLLCGSLWMIIILIEESNGPD